MCWGTRWRQIYCVFRVSACVRPPKWPKLSQRKRKRKTYSRTNETDAHKHTHTRSEKPESRIADPCSRLAKGTRWQMDATNCIKVEDKCDSVLIALDFGCRQRRAILRAAFCIHAHAFVDVRVVGAKRHGLCVAKMRWVNSSCSWVIMLPSDRTTHKRGLWCDGR